MKALVIGGGGREHALAWKLAASPRLARIFVAPGNGGTARDRRLQNVRSPIQNHSPSLPARRHWTYGGGPEAPLAAGVVDAFQARGLRVFGPTRAAAQLESSKDFAKAFMQRHGIPTAAIKPSPASPMRSHISIARTRRSSSRPMVWRRQGVVVAQTRAEAKHAVEAMLLDNRLGGPARALSSKIFLPAKRRASSS